MPIIPRPLVPPISSSRRGDRVNQDTGRRDAARPRRYRDARSARQHRERINLDEFPVAE
ncbi:MAG TPA: hypothetical protein VLM11_22435 [Streptosporangiaceae bacterium]|nr:hypothetical protein [Streptosporangiaceae bacterium]